jgi:hypothetical protein
LTTWNGGSGGEPWLVNQHLHSVFFCHFWTKKFAKIIISSVNLTIFWFLVSIFFFQIFDIKNEGKTHFLGKKIKRPIIKFTLKYYKYAKLRLHAPTLLMTILGYSPSEITCQLDATIYFLVPPPALVLLGLEYVAMGVATSSIFGVPPLGHAQFSTLGRVMHGQVQSTLLRKQSAQMDGFGRLLWR